MLRQAIELAAKEGVDNQFNKLVSTLTGSGITLGEIDAAIGQNEQLTKTLREMIAILLTDNQAAKLKEEQRPAARPAQAARKGHPRPEAGTVPHRVRPGR